MKENGYKRSLNGPSKYMKTNVVKTEKEKENIKMSLKAAGNGSQCTGNPAIFSSGSQILLMSVFTYTSI